MADNIWDDEDDEIESAPSGNDLVKQLRKLVKDEKARAKALEDEVKTLRPAVRKSQVSSLLKNANVDLKYAGLFPADLEPSEENVKAWAEEYGFAGQATNAPSADTAATDNSSSAADNVDPAVVDQWNRIQSQQSASGNTTPDQESQHLAQLQAAHKAANGDTDKFFAMLSGAEPIPN